MLSKKIKDLRYVGGECNLRSYFPNFNFKYCLIEKRSSRSYYLYVHEFNHEFPLIYTRVPAISTIEEIRKMVFDVKK